MKFRSADVSYYLNQLKVKGYQVVKVEHQKHPSADIYILENSKGQRVRVYKTCNSWIEITGAGL